MNARDIANLHAFDSNLSKGKVNFGTSMVELEDKEKIEFSKKLILPSVNKLKNMIDELYSKEKKYVKQYVREDFIE
jgi:hypothetical protein